MKPSEEAQELAERARQLGHDVADKFGTEDDSPSVVLWDAAERLNSAATRLESSGE